MNETNLIIYPYYLKKATINEISYLHQHCRKINE